MTDREKTSNQVPMQPDAAEKVMLAERLAQGAGESMSAYRMLPSITVHNDKTNKDYEVGDIIKSVKTQNGYENEKFEKPFKGVITKVRMYLTTKFKAKEQGAPDRITDEFEAYDDLITLKEKRDGKYEIVEQDNYKNIQDKYSSENKYGKVERELDLVYCLYTITDLNAPELARILAKGTSRSNLFSYMKEFSRREGDFMSSHWTEFNTEMVEKNFRGEPMQFPVAAITFTKKELMSLEELRKAVDIQVELERGFEMFKKKPTQIDTPSAKALEAPKEELPTINLDEDQPTEIPTVEDKKEEEVKIEDIPF